VAVSAGGIPILATKKVVRAAAVLELFAPKTEYIGYA